MPRTYVKHMEYLFEANRTSVALSEPYEHEGATRCTVEETRKNSQEDCHMAGEVELQDGEWVWLWGADMFDEYSYPGTADAIIAYLNKHKPPFLIKTHNRSK